MEKKAYVVATAHLDTVWRWNLAQTIKEFIPDTLEKNAELIKKYPHYRFNFEGAFRYKLMEEYYPEAFEQLKKLVAEGKWNPIGSEFENGDVNIPSPEALFRNILLGNRYFQQKFGKTCNDIFLPDCFGFGYALPSVMKHSGLKGFSTQKLTWGSAYGIPFDLGYFQGPDGAKVLAELDARSYTFKFNSDIRGYVNVIDKVSRNAFDSGIPQTMHYYGVGDKGGSPAEESVAAVEESINKNSESDFEVVAASSCEFFDDISNLPQETLNKLPVWNNELLMTAHGAGSYTSRTQSKRQNAKCEQIADFAEKACTAAEVLGLYKYPRENITRAWESIIQHHFHDDITGTSNMDVYVDGHNDYIVAQKQLQTEYLGAVSAIANELDTSRVSECAVIVNNPAAIARRDVVNARVKLNHNSTFIKVVDCDGNEVPSQVINKMGKVFDIAFVAEVEPLGFKVYDIQAANKACQIETDIKASGHTLENEKYQVIFNKNGDIASVIDKKTKRQLIETPAKIAKFTNTGAYNYPSWEIRHEDISNEIEVFANQPEFEITENGPARAAIKITRVINHSRIEQTISLTSGGKFIRVDNKLDWRSRRSLLKAVFPFTCYNNEATYDLGLGTIKRGNNSETLYEVPAQKWADITAGTGEYGVSVFSDCKYGWDKPDSNTLRLTLMHTPGGAFTKETRQDLQDLGRNEFAFGIYSHEGGYENGTQAQSELFCKPLIAFQTSSRREGKLGESFSFARLSSDGVIIRAIKLAEDDNAVIVRINEGNGKAQKGVKLNFCAKIENACETLANEEKIGEAEFSGNELCFDIEPFGIKTFKIYFAAAEKSGKENFKKIELECNAKGFTSRTNMRNVIIQGGGCSLPADLYPDSITYGGITFRLTNPNADADIMVARGQEIEIPKASTKLYILAASTLDDREVTFLADNREVELTIHSFKEPIGKFDMAGLDQKMQIKEANPALIFTHTNHPEGPIPNGKAYFYMYEIDVRNKTTLTLPEDNRIIILAMTAVKKFSNTVQATRLIDKSPEEDYYFNDIPPIDKILDHAGAITMRLGKIQDQRKTGKGKGFKRDNIVTNIIRSYTKSEW